MFVSCVKENAPLFLEKNFLLYAFFWGITWLLEFKCRRFGTLCLFDLHRQVDLPDFEDGIDRVFRNVGI
jgi:hypothetical protein